jgi:predicted RNase H-like HicB family nuclease
MTQKQTFTAIIQNPSGASGGRRVCFCYNESRERQAEMKFTVEYEQEEDGRWLAEVKELPGVLAYGKDPDDATDRAQALALRVIEDRLENGEGLSS